MIIVQMRKFGPYLGSTISFIFFGLGIATYLISGNIRIILYSIVAGGLGIFSILLGHSFKMYIDDSRVKIEYIKCLEFLRPKEIGSTLILEWDEITELRYELRSIIDAGYYIYYKREKDKEERSIGLMDVMHGHTNVPQAVTKIAQHIPPEKIGPVVITDIQKWKKKGKVK